MTRTARLSLDVAHAPVAAFYCTGMDDAALVARVLEGDVAAFTEIVNRHYRDCTRFAVRMLGDRHDAEDAIQEPFLQVKVRLDEGAWLPPAGLATTADGFNGSAGVFVAE